MAIPKPITDVPSLEQHGAYPWQSGGGGVGLPWVNGGNAFGADASLGLTDAHTIRLFRVADNFITYDGTTLTLLGAGGVNLRATSGPINIGVTGGDADITIDNSSNTSNPITISAGTLIKMSASGAVEIATLDGVAIASAGFASPDPSALLDVQTTDHGFLAPRLTTVQRGALPNPPASGLQIVNTTTHQPEINVGTPGTPIWATMAAQYGGPIALVNGVVQVSNVNLTSASVILVSVGNPVPGAGNTTIRYDVLEADRTNGVGNGSFKISALVAAGTLNALDQSTGVRWAIVGQ